MYTANIATFLALNRIKYEANFCEEVYVENVYATTEVALLRQQRIRLSYRTALDRYKTTSNINQVPWVVWLITLATVAIWCFIAYQTAIAVGAHNLRAVFADIAANAVNVQPQDNDALSNVLITYGAKENTLIQQGQYWRFVAPIFLHVNLIHIGLNMLNFVVLGVFLERLAGHLRFLLLYLITGIISVIASYYFAPREISVGASGAIFGLVGAYSIFVLSHRQAFPRGGVPALLWLVVIIGVNLGLGLLVPNVDNYAHLGGLISGCVLGWEFMPFYAATKTGKTLPAQQKEHQFSYPPMYGAQTLEDTHSLARRWPLALLTVVGTLALAILALHQTGG